MEAILIVTQPLNSAATRYVMRDSRISVHWSS